MPDEIRTAAQPAEPREYTREEMRDACRNNYNAALEKAAITPGYAIVPLEPTPEMLAAWYKVKNGFHYHDEPPPADTSDVAAYGALLAAVKEMP